jgi:hypothetical protein
MVDVKQIATTFHKYFSHSGVVTHIDPETGLIDVDGYVILKRQVSRLPVSFGNVSGDFICGDSKLTTLKGAPSHVRGGFVCSHNMLTSLTHAPEYVGADFKCAYNKLTNLKGAPDSVGTDFNCALNPLENLEGAPSHVNGAFIVSYAPDLPLLRVLNARQGVWLDWGLKPHQEVEHILNDDEFKGKGKVGAIRCAIALIKAGYKANARW